MKNYITVAALLAAGAAFANADVVLHDITFADGNVITSDASLSNTGVSATITTNPADKTLYQSTILGVYSGPVKELPNVTLWVKEGGTYKGNNNLTLNALKLDSGVSILSGVGATPSANEVSFNDGRNITLTGTDGFLDVDCDTFGKVIVSGLSGDSAVYLNSNGKLTLNSGNTLSDDVDIYAIVSGDAGSRTLVSGLSDGWSGSVFISTNDGTSYEKASFTVSGGELSVSTIPEPSAFGLLAGLGALALVASRRRRK
ncbi:MAG TPA: PEP-CTERM sorting domain-containing protein [Candidatus Spyradosoma merdigallinarum]|uniref:PEP-CTERM sorting domain-containing protein n=1 Tax=Candidatus Spyradosoma merdigallinarum TaxID=2840950 RepID=A0A9D1NJ39_9BACT|nr:PEP-CTERM sorting domain-containing protein [Candidatus Spyradosoma merdigallinarum]